MECRSESVCGEMGRWVDVCRWGWICAKECWGPFMGFGGGNFLVGGGDGPALAVGAAGVFLVAPTPGGGAIPGGICMMVSDR